MTGLVLSALYRYPVKSLRGQQLDASEVCDRGLRFDRDWMLVDMQGRFLTQRQQPRMSLIRTEVDADGRLQLGAPGMSDIAVGLYSQGRVEVTVWDDTLSAALLDAEVNDWLSEFLALPCRLVQFPRDAVRTVDADYARPADRVGFADGFPFMLISQASLDDLNARLEQPVAMWRFRPNLVVNGCAPYAEDDWCAIRIGERTFRVAKPCARCIIPTVDPQTGVRGAEPLRTLLTYRRRDKKVFLGQNLVHDSSGRLEVGMPVEVLQ